MGVVKIGRIFAVFALFLVFLCSCSAKADNPPPTAGAVPEPYFHTPEQQSDTPEPESAEQEFAEHEPVADEISPVDAIIKNMTLSERVSQLFVLTIDTTEKAPSEELRAFITETRAGGYILFTDDITTVEGTLALTDAVKSYSSITPFICIDEEGGAVSRLYSAKLPGYEKKPSAAAIGASGDVDTAFTVGADIGKALNSIGVSVNFAPVADVLTNLGNTAIKSRAFGTQPGPVSDMAAAFISGLHSEGILAAAKHFPGHGNTTGDTHLGSAVIKSDPEHLSRVEYPPFIRAIDEGCEFIMTGHITAPEADDSGLPATLSWYFIGDILRTELGFDGIIITDAMNMRAITDNFSPGDAAVLAISAGADMILMPEDFYAARNGVIKAVEDGVITRERINESLTRILRTKIQVDYLG